MPQFGDGFFFLWLTGNVDQVGSHTRVDKADLSRTTNHPKEPAGVGRPGEIYGIRHRSIREQTDIHSSGEKVDIRRQWGLQMRDLSSRIDGRSVSEGDWAACSTM